MQADGAKIFFRTLSCPGLLFSTRAFEAGLTVVTAEVIHEGRGPPIKARLVSLAARNICLPAANSEGEVSGSAGGVIIGTAWIKPRVRSSR